MSHGQRAMQLLAERIGRPVDPDTGFRLLDSKLQQLVGFARQQAAVIDAFEQALCGMAFDHGVIFELASEADFESAKPWLRLDRDWWHATPLLEPPAGASVIQPKLVLAR